MDKKVVALERYIYKATAFYGFKNCKQHFVKIKTVSKSKHNIILFKTAAFNVSAYKHFVSAKCSKSACKILFQID